MRLQRESCVYIVYLCREIVANYSRTSLQLLHSSEIGALMRIRNIMPLMRYKMFKFSCVSGKVFDRSRKGSVSFHENYTLANDGHKVYFKSTFKGNS